MSFEDKTITFRNSNSEISSREIKAFSECYKHLVFKEIDLKNNHLRAASVLNKSTINPELQITPKENSLSSYDNYCNKTIDHSHVSTLSDTNFSIDQINEGSLRHKQSNTETQFRSELNEDLIKIEPREHSKSLSIICNNINDKTYNDNEEKFRDKSIINSIKNSFQGCSSLKDDYNFSINYNQEKNKFEVIPTVLKVPQKEIRRFSNEKCDEIDLFSKNMINQESLINDLTQNNDNNINTNLSEKKKYYDRSIIQSENSTKNFSLNEKVTNKTMKGNDMPSISNKLSFYKKNNDNNSKENRINDMLIEEQEKKTDFFFETVYAGEVSKIIRKNIIHEDDVREFFSALDNNNGGTLDLNEFKRAFLNIAS